MLGLPDQLFTPMFAVARVVGWSAHRIEELMNCDKIIRPAYQSIAAEKRMCRCPRGRQQSNSRHTGGNMEFEEAGSSKQSAQQIIKEKAAGEGPEDAEQDRACEQKVCADDYKELIVQMRKGTYPLSADEQHPAGRADHAAGHQPQSRATRGRPGLRTRGRHAAVPAGRLADAPHPGEKGLHPDEERRGRPALRLRLPHGKRTGSPSPEMHGGYCILETGCGSGWAVSACMSIWIIARGFMRFCQKRL